MQVDKVSFQAHVPSRLKNSLFMTAHCKGHAVCDAYLAQAKKVEGWGMDSSVITNIRPDGKQSVLSLVNSYFAPFKHAEFPQKETLFDTFMSLTERDILNAENSLNI